MPSILREENIILRIHWNNVGTNKTSILDKFSLLLRLLGGGGGSRMLLLVNYKCAAKKCHYNTFQCILRLEENHSVWYLLIDSLGYFRLLLLACLGDLLLVLFQRVSVYVLDVR